MPCCVMKRGDLKPNSCEVDHLHHLVGAITMNVNFDIAAQRRPDGFEHRRVSVIAALSRALRALRYPPTFARTPPPR